MGALLPAIGLGARAVSSFFGSRAQQRRNEEQRRAQIAGLGVAHQQREDTRIGNNRLGAALLGGVTGRSPSAYHGRIEMPTFTPTEGMTTPRKYDFASTVPDANAGAGNALVSSLFGSAADVLGMPGNRGQSQPSQAAPSAMGAPNAGPPAEAGPSGDSLAAMSGIEGLDPETIMAIVNALG